MKIRVSEKIINEYIIRPSAKERYPFFWNCMAVIVIFGTLFPIISNMDLSKSYSLILFLFFIIRIFIYEFIDVVFKKRIIYTIDDNIYIRFIFYWKVNSNRSYLNIEKNWTVASNGIPDTILILNRNNDGLLKRFFKNKIKLYYVEDSNKKEVIQKGIEISEMFGINFWNTNEAKE